MAKNDRNPLQNESAPSQPASAEVGADLLCDNFEGTSAPVVGKVLGKDDKWVRLRIEELGRDWLVRPDRIDLARGSWEHVAADYPALAENAEFDAEFRPLRVAKQDPKHAAKIKAAAEAFGALLPESLRKHVDDLAGGAVDRLTVGPDGSVLARWNGKGTLDAPFVERKTRVVKRGATTGTEGWFPRPAVAKYARHFEML